MILFAKRHRVFRERGRSALIGKKAVEWKKRWVFSHNRARNALSLSA